MRAGGSLVGESILSRYDGHLNLVRYAHTDSPRILRARRPWVQRAEIESAFRDNDSRVLPLDDPAMW